MPPEPSAALVSRAGLEVAEAALVEAGVVQVDRGARLLSALSVSKGFWGRSQDLFLVMGRCADGAGDQPKMASTPLVKSRSRPATSATINATKMITTVV